VEGSASSAETLVKKLWARYLVWYDMSYRERWAAITTLYHKVVGHPKDQVNPFGKDVHIVVGILQRIVLVNLIAFCTVMVFLIIVEATKPTPATPVEKPQAPTVYERAQKDY